MEIGGTLHSFGEQRGPGTEAQACWDASSAQKTTEFRNGSLCFWNLTTIKSLLGKVIGNNKGWTLWSLVYEMLCLIFTHTVLRDGWNRGPGVKSLLSHESHKFLHLLSSSKVVAEIISMQRNGARCQRVHRWLSKWTSRPNLLHRVLGRQNMWRNPTPWMLLCSEKKQDVRCEG